MGRIKILALALAFLFQTSFAVAAETHTSSVARNEVLLRAAKQCLSAPDLCHITAEAKGLIEIRDEELRKANLKISNLEKEVSRADSIPVAPEIPVDSGPDIPLLIIVASLAATAGVVIGWAIFHPTQSLIP